MANNGPCIKATFIAGEDLSDDQYKAVYMSAADTVKLVDATTKIPVGILQNAPESGGEAVVVILGVTKIKVGDDLDVTDYIFIDSAGEADDVTLGSDDQKAVIGQAISAGDDGSFATAIVNFANPPTTNKALT